MDDPTQRVRQQSLISRFMDLYAINRLDAQDTLRKYTGDYENIQRIICNAVVVRILDDFYGHRLLEFQFAIGNQSCFDEFALGSVQRCEAARSRLSQPRAR